MAEQIREWLTTFSNQTVQIWCEDPETTTVPGVITKSYLTYRILMKQFGRDIVGIRHRYSEFEALRTILKDKYAPYGILIPSLPPKNSVASLIVSKSGDKDIFIKERTLGLTMFCEGIVASPWLRNDSNWKSFMIAGSGEPDNANNAGEIKLLETMALLEIPYKYTMIQRMEDIKMEVLLIEKQIRAMLDRARSVQSCEKSLQAANEAFYTTSCAWLDAERNGVKSLAGRAFDENESILQPTEHVSATLSAAVQLLNAKSNIHIGDPEYSGITIATILEQELAMVESFKELFKVHEEIVHSIDLVSAKLNKVQGTGKASDRDKENEFKKTLDEKHQCLTAFYKGFIYFSLPASAKYRAQTIRKLSSATAASHLTSSFVYQKACVDYFRSLNINPASAINETSRMLELLSIKQLDKLPEEFEDKNGHDVPIKSGSFESLFQRAIIIGKGKQGAHSVVPVLSSMEGLKVSSSPAAGAPTTATAAVLTSEHKPNPLAVRRGSAVMASKSFVDPNASSPSVAAGTGAAGHSSSASGANVNLDSDIQQVEEEDV